MNLRARFSAIHQDHHRIARAAGRVAFFLVIGKMAGALKEMAIAYRYGMSPEVDAYQFTMTLTTWLPVTVVGVLSVVLIPVLVALNKKTPKEKTSFVREFQGWLLLLGLALVVLTICAWPEILKQLGASLSAEVQGMTTSLLWAFAPGALLTLFVGFSAARLRAQERHINTLLDSVPALVLLVWLALPHCYGVAWSVLLFKRFGLSPLRRRQMKQVGGSQSYRFDPTNGRRCLMPWVLC